jgi:hypothetical protein
MEPYLQIALDQYVAGLIKDQEGADPAFIAEFITFDLGNPAIRQMLAKVIARSLKEQGIAE